MTSIAIGVLALGGDHKKLFEIIPDHVKQSWREWAPEGLILISITSQIVLFLLGGLRKHNPRTRIRIALWCAYLLAYAVASGALSVITRSALDVCSSATSNRNSEYEKLNTSELVSFWAPFLLLHLGGPDTITAYSLEDNELWLRHLAEVVFQSGVALYILLLSWPGCSNLPLLSILVYIVGFFKCYERIQALRLANTEHLRDSMLGPPDPGPNYAKFLEDYHLRENQGYDVTIGEVPEAPVPETHHARPSQDNAIAEAYTLFQTFERIFVDLILTFEEKDKSSSYFHQLTSSKAAFSTVDIELGFAYDTLYTKAKVVYTFVGLVIRVTSVCILLLALLGFYFICDVDNYRVIDIYITYLLFGTTVLMEILAVITMLRSDWTDVWLSQHKKSRDILVLPFLKKKPTTQRWSNSVAQLDLLSVALEEKPASLLTAQKFFGIDKYRVKHRYKTYINVSDNLKDLIYNWSKEFMKPDSDPKALCSHKGSFSLFKNKSDDLLWSIRKVEFDQSIIIWHIATTLCYYSDKQDQGDMDVYRLESKRISDYMLYLLVSYPVMLPIGIGMIRYRDTCAEATRYFKENGLTGKDEACNKLLEVYHPNVPPKQVKGDRCKSVLFDGVTLALKLKEKGKEHMWKVMSEVWIEILAYAATHCRGFQHEQQLRKGGEFLTHVWLLMAHLGITEQFQVSQGHARARLVVS